MKLGADMDPRGESAMQTTESYIENHTYNWPQCIIYQTNKQNYLLPSIKSTFLTIFKHAGV